MRFIAFHWNHLDEEVQDRQGGQRGLVFLSSLAFNLLYPHHDDIE